MTIYPFYRVFTETGEQYCDCGWEKHAQELILLNKGVQRLSYRRIDAPKPINPETVDVGVIPVEELTGQQGLPKAVDRLPFEPEEEELGLPQSELYEF
jgi:hypothetical protein|tara:strand:- start:1199 stop:1492 length:294 start_codon:yes stop_codon:yes gene_type:complete